MHTYTLHVYVVYVEHCEPNVNSSEVGLLCVFAGCEFSGLPAIASCTDTTPVDDQLALSDYRNAYCSRIECFRSGVWSTLSASELTDPTDPQTPGERNNSHISLTKI